MDDEKIENSKVKDTEQRAHRSKNAYAGHIGVMKCMSMMRHQDEYTFFKVVKFEVLITLNIHFKDVGIEYN